MVVVVVVVLVLLLFHSKTCVNTISLFSYLLGADYLLSTTYSTASLSWISVVSGPQCIPIQEYHSIAHCTGELFE